MINEHLADIAKVLVESNGLNYPSAGMSPQNRVYQHASHTRILVEHLIALDSSTYYPSSTQDESCFFVRIVADPSGSKKGDDGDTPQVFDDPLEKEDQAVFDELNIGRSNVVLEISRPFIELHMKANGKADLYFHAYFRQQYLQQLMDAQLR